MNTRFSVESTPHYARLARRLARQRPDFVDIYEQALNILEKDPTNQTRRHQIKKLTNVPTGEGQWRLRIGRFRFRYDIAKSTVSLLYCGLRREDTYR